MRELPEFDRHKAARGVSEARRRDLQRCLHEFGDSLNGRLHEASGADLAAYLAARHNRGYAPGTLRKERHMVLSYFAWAFEAGHINADALLSLRAAKSPESAPGQVRPNPYTPKELRNLRTVLDTRWPKLPPDEVWKRVTRWRAGITPYRRIRKHAIRLQLEAVLALCLHGGLRRAEVLALHLDDLHPDNAYVVVWRGERFQGEAREVPFTAACRERVAEWIELRAAMQPDHDRPWLGLHAEKTAREPIAPGTFGKLLARQLGAEWSFRRLRLTAGARWIEAGMTTVELQRFLGHRALKGVAPFVEAIDVPLDRRMESLERPFTRRLPLAV